MNEIAENRVMTPTPEDGSLPVWQSALLSHGCQVNSDGKFFALDLQPLGDRITCTPTASGRMLPFRVSVTVGQPVTITWDSGISRYIVSAAGNTSAE